MRKLFSLVLILTLTFPTFSQSPVPPPQEITGTNKVDGLSLPDDVTVQFDEGFVKLKADCNGEVRWLVLSRLKVKYLIIPLENTIIVSVPPQGGVISVYAVGLVGGKLTEFARTNITVVGNNPNPNPNPGPSPDNQAGRPYHVTFLVDLNNSNPDLGQILTSQNIKETITNKGGSYYRQYDFKSQVLKEKGLDRVIADFAKKRNLNVQQLPPMVVVQASNGNIKVIDLMPKTEAEVVQYLNNVLGVK